jgi:pimeloyl-ACP methyl ester carboxylesterase
MRQRASPDRLRAMTERPHTFDPELTELDYPRPVHFYEFESQSQELRMAYMVAEPERFNGHTVILLHGKNFSGAYWEPTIARLVEEDFRVVAPDEVGLRQVL